MPFAASYAAMNLRCPWRAAKADLWAIFGAVVNADVAVPVTVLDTAGWQSAGHGGRS